MALNTAIAALKIKLMEILSDSTMPKSQHQKTDTYNKKKERQNSSDVKSDVISHKQMDPYKGSPFTVSVYTVSRCAGADEVAALTQP
ncbi:hypothetical protein EVAR_8539_1 [Eumeta japonica]|uniref:Uncharacterized protein n=1 Tax=Eumeta variegata TaxID=151549 RepID=A0A4C1TXX8_EUMVA|nr:hypothetical protein EVAR_8539_1 [Eumeta japonica]